MELVNDPFFFLPTLYSFLNANTFIGSFRGLRFQVQPDITEGKGDTAKGTLKTLVWYGEACLELSQVVATGEFPLTEDGRNDVIDWLGREYDTYLAQLDPAVDAAKT